MGSSQRVSLASAEDLTESGSEDDEVANRQRCENDRQRHDHEDSSDYDEDYEMVESEHEVYFRCK